MTELPAPWAQASLDDADAFDFSLPQAAATEAAPHNLGRLYRDELSSPSNEKSEPRARVLAMLAAALQMHDRLDLPKAPYGAMMQMGDRRTAIPTDWKGESISVWSAWAAGHPIPSYEPGYVTSPGFFKEVGCRQVIRRLRLILRLPEDCAMA